MRPLGRRLPPLRVPENLDMPDSFRDRRFEVEKIDGLGQEVERAPVHRGADIGHVAIRRDDDGRQIFVVFLKLL